MTDRIKKALGDLKVRQDAGEHMPCPRCGRDSMKKRVGIKLTVPDAIKSLKVA